MFYKKLVFHQKTKFIIDDSKHFKKFDTKFVKSHPKLFVIIDNQVLIKHKFFISFLKKINSNVFIKKISSNEKIKNVKFYNSFIKFLSNKNCSSKDLIIAVGGGVVLDISGFLASTYMRKIDLLMIPTNLIGMVDASTAGKTCLNTDNGKNLIGTFYLPNIVYNNINFLKSTNKSSLRQGFAEIFKYGLLSSKKLIKLVLKYKIKPSDQLLKEIIKLTINKRFEIRTFNPLASNLGHTFGHAIEKMTNYKVKHGDAISIGTVLALKFSIHEKIIKVSLYSYIIKLMKQIDLCTSIKTRFDSKKWVTLMLKDKKSYDNKIGLILIKDIGKQYKINNLPFYYASKEKMIKFLTTMKKYEY